ncbi:hypothetical protein ACVIJ6_004206 [Bradyrhizobium sp. USDA 4369]
MKNNLNDAGDPAAFGDKAACTSAERRNEKAQQLCETIRLHG